MALGIQHFSKLIVAISLVKVNERVNMFVLRGVRLEEGTWLIGSHVSMADSLGRIGIPSICTFGRPYIIPGTDPFAYRFRYLLLLRHLLTIWIVICQFSMTEDISFWTRLNMLVSEIISIIFFNIVMFVQQNNVISLAGSVTIVSNFDNYLSDRNSSLDKFLSVTE